jgi:hypothetical protein
MTPAEKAQDLIGKFKPLMDNWDDYYDVPREEDEIVNDAKKCAIICADEILSTLRNCWDERGAYVEHEYWRSVKLELKEIK